MWEDTPVLVGDTFPGNQTHPVILYCAAVWLLPEQIFTNDPYYLLAI
jgi:hypothetical protein